MNFYDLFEASKEKSSEEHQDVTIADPKAALALKAARNKYSYADSDLEAFVKMVQDEQEAEQDEIDDLEAETAKQEELIQRNIEALKKNQDTIAKTREQAQAAKERADQLERQNKAQNHELSRLRAARSEYEKWASATADLINNMQQSIAGALPDQTKFKPTPLAKPQAAPQSEPEEPILRDLPGLRK